MVARSERLLGPFRGSLPADAGDGARWPSRLSLVVLLIAGLVAGLAALFRADGSAPAPVGPAIQISLPGVGAGAPQTLAELQSLQAAVGSGTELDSPLALTARRYAAHLVADIVDAPRLTVLPLRSAEEVQIALAVAASPQLFRRSQGAEAAGGIPESVQLARLGLSPGSALPPFFLYDVQRGDSVEKLARRFDLQPDSILFNNWEIRDPDFLEADTQLAIPTGDGVIYTVLLGDTLLEIVENYAADMETILAFEGNGLSSPDRLVEGSTILLVGGSASLAFGAGGPVYAIPDFRWPMGGIVTDFFGVPRGNRYGFHTGVDLSAPLGTFIGAAAPGLVVQAGWDGGFGLSVLVDHGGGVLTRYAHLNHIDVFLGERVEPGDLIGFLGNTGYSFGPHLHFEIIMGGVPQNPLVWLNS